MQMAFHNNMWREPISILATLFIIIEMSFLRKNLFEQSTIEIGFLAECQRIGTRS